MRCCFPPVCTCPPSDTTCMTVAARDVQEGDYLDTRGDGASGYIARVFTPPEVQGRAESAPCTLNVMGQRQWKGSARTRVKVWRDSTRVECQPRPIGLRTDRPFRNLTEVHRAGAAGLNATFPVGSVWEVGPFTEGDDPVVVRVVSAGRKRDSRGGGAAYTSGVNHSAAPEDAEARGRHCWFIATECVWTPHTVRGGGGQPPAVLCALTPRMAAKARVGLPQCFPGPCRPPHTCCCSPYSPPTCCPPPDEELLRTIREQEETIACLEGSLAREQEQRFAAERRVNRAREALR